MLLNGKPIHDMTYDELYEALENEVLFPEERKKILDRMSLIDQMIKLVDKTIKGDD